MEPPIVEVQPQQDQEEVARLMARYNVAAMPVVDPAGRLLGRITFDELAAQVQLSASAVLRRVRRLEEAGVIAGYAALVPPARIGLHLSAYIEVRLQHGAEARTARVTEQFRAAGKQVILFPDNLKSGELVVIEGGYGLPDGTEVRW